MDWSIPDGELSQKRWQRGGHRVMGEEDLIWAAASARDVGDWSKFAATGLRVMVNLRACPSWTLSPSSSPPKSLFSGEPVALSEGKLAAALFNFAYGSWGWGN